jgi:hypothetical protein
MPSLHLYLESESSLFHDESDSHGENLQKKTLAVYGTPPGGHVWNFCRRALSVAKCPPGQSSLAMRKMNLEECESPS